ncbi:uncharacterized protein BT62DRAFT_1012391 [Guyanagaster necrorhizus]|uniref:Amino acid transporter n=1 Tax=Guyanagaster necrorhizus TaxID=856835 RepID=A0A9P7VHQ9_9AGAR|nr:uncharacterized protein BT62DRAFT_1012391 [Guyanagaster necrorhizus MCA 3950]KAG7440798.1 hypothetical protein BT62DRAFT_1012391 [Guyanagaster necrorhizus MCA 3950]
MAIFTYNSEETHYALHLCFYLELYFLQLASIGRDSSCAIDGNLVKSLSSSSAHPTSGGPYSGRPCFQNYNTLSCRHGYAVHVGWLNLLGQFAITTGISFACASFLSTVCTLKTDFVPTSRTQIGVWAAALVVQGQQNSLRLIWSPFDGHVGLINTFGVHILHYLNNVSAPTHQSAKFVFSHFIDGTDGWGERASHAYVVVIGTLMAQYTLTDSMLMTEETRNAAMSGSIGGILRSKFFAVISSKWKSPIRTTLSFIPGLLSLASTVAFSAATSIATIGLYISHNVRVALRVINRENFVRGPFHLGSFSYPVAMAAVLWIMFISIAFILPQVNPVDLQTFDYSIVAVGIVITYSFGYWFLSARKWFAGPVKQIAASVIPVITINALGPAGLIASVVVDYSDEPHLLRLSDRLFYFFLEALDDLKSWSALQSNMCVLVLNGDPITVLFFKTPIDPERLTVSDSSHVHAMGRGLDNIADISVVDPRRRQQP